MRTRTVVLATGATVALAATFALSADGQYELLLSGPVESVDRTANAITVLGHRLVIRDVSAIAPGHKVNVFGSIGLGGSTSPAVVQDTRAFAASGDPVLVVGRVSTIDQSRGRVIIDGASVDYTILLAQPTFALPAIGDRVRVLGTQPAGKGTVLAGAIITSSSVSGGSKAIGVSGGSIANGVSGGSSANGVSGGSIANGVSGGSIANGVSGGSIANGVSGGSRAIGVSGGSIANGVSGGSIANGVSGGSIANGVSAHGAAI
jgi:hypothetical protein